MPSFVIIALVAAGTLNCTQIHTQITTFFWSTHYFRQDWGIIKTGVLVKYRNVAPPTYISYKSLAYQHSCSSPSQLCLMYTILKQEKQMLNQSIFAILKGILHNHFPYIIMNIWVAPNFQQNDGTSSTFPWTLWPWVNIKVIQIEWNQTAELKSVQHHIHTKFETNWSTSVLAHYNVKHIFHKIMSAEFPPLNITCAI